MSRPKQPIGARDAIARVLFGIADERGWTLSELAARSGWSINSLSAARGGRRRLSLAMARDIAEALGWELVLVPHRKLPGAPPVAVPLAPVPDSRVRKDPR